MQAPYCTENWLDSNIISHPAGGLLVEEPMSHSAHRNCHCDHS